MSRPPKLVLMPGLDGTGTLFQEFRNALSPCFQVETIAFPSQSNLSYAELAVFIERFIPNSEPFVLIAESFSAPLAIQLASKQPSNLLGMVLCAGFAESPVSKWLSALGTPISSLPFLIPPPTTLVRHLLVGPSASHALVSAVQRAIASVDSSVLAHRLQSVLKCDVTAELAQITAPILYLRATHDRLVPASSLALIKTIIPALMINEIAGPHLLFQREPGLTAEIVTQFIGTL